MPLDMEAFRQFFGNLVYRVDRISRAESAGRRSHNFHCGDTIEALIARRTVNPFTAAESRKWHHLAATVAKIPLVQILRRHARRSPSLDIDLLNPILIHKLIYIGRSPRGR